MELSSSDKERIQHQYDALAKKTLVGEAKSHRRTLAKRAAREVTFSDLSESELAQLSRAQVDAAVEDSSQRDAEAVHGGLHALEDVDAHEVGHRRRAVDLALEVLAPRVPVAVLVLAALVGAHVGEHLVLGERELGDHVVEHGNRRQLAF